MLIIPADTFGPSASLHLNHTPGSLPASLGAREKYDKTRNCVSGASYLHTPNHGPVRRWVFRDAPGFSASIGDAQSVSSVFILDTDGFSWTKLYAGSTFHAVLCVFAGYCTVFPGIDLGGTGFHARPLPRAAFGSITSLNMLSPHGLLATYPTLILHFQRK